MCGERDAMVSTDMCFECQDQWQQDNDRIEDLIKDGHAKHCAFRQVWGDGECECDLYALGYKPNAWLWKLFCKRLNGEYKHMWE